MATTTKYRIASIDLLKGLAMVIMALDHVRDYFHLPAHFTDPTDPVQSSFPIFLTRFITHFCAPTFCFLAGTSAFLVGRRKSKRELTRFLLQRGFWLVFIEFTIVNFGWYFDPQYRSHDLLVIWSLGISMIVLSGLIQLPMKVILAFCCLLIFGHNLLDDVHFPNNILWAVLHEQLFMNISGEQNFFVGYPIIPWIAVMGLGYYFGQFYDASFNTEKRKRLFNVIGLSALLLFAVLRLTNVYGDRDHFEQYPAIHQDLMSFFNPSKYPPSLQYLLMTLGVAFLFLANAEKLKGKIVNFFAVFGRVPFFYYILHIYLIHLLAMIVAEATGFGWDKLILAGWVTEMPQMKQFGYGLWVVYSVWILVIALLYPLCRKFDQYKQSHKDKWWLSYL